jgi:hypothetical protein
VSGSAAAEAAVELAVELVRTDSVNPGLVPGAAGEAAIAGLLARRLERGGFAVETVGGAILGGCRLVQQGYPFNYGGGQVHWRVSRGA